MQNLGLSRDRLEPEKMNFEQVWLKRPISFNSKASPNLLISTSMLKNFLVHLIANFELLQFNAILLKYFHIGYLIFDLIAPTSRIS